MGGDPKSVLVVADDEAAELESGFDEEAVAVTVLTDRRNVFDELTHGVYQCLVLTATVGGQSGTDIAYGVTKLFPDLPVVVVGVDPAVVPDDLDVRAVASPDLGSQAVVDAIGTSLDGDAPSVAGRSPSPMETLLLSLFNEMPDHLYAKDDQARHVLMGRGFNEPTDRVGLTDREVSELADEHGEAAYRDEMDILEGEVDRIDVEEFLDLAAPYVRTRKVPWYDADGEIQGLVGLTQDITARKTREHDLRRQHERMVKVALVSAHELRNELQIAHGRLERLDDDTQTAPIEESLSRISSLVDTVVQLSTRESDRQEQTPVWLSRLSREVWETVADAHAALEIDGDARFLADQESASLLLQFLFQNALEHGASTVTVGTTSTGFYVANDGPEIEVSPPERVFDAGYTTVEGNTGFGLYIAKSVAEDQGWTLSLTDATAGSVRFDVENVDLHG
ncbi:PAS domain-containing sensor histidine kinase [Halomicroarcula sp. S1AR25-4]|uniref:sensor histidine kinase n=1 Tax=Haloarcula sp. S1AR25-4 TaxID=2950538 RepID=UPI00287697A9|nr:ATP-binding protein [Halomicroarcula sp. S1AR25-4]MDS0279456.1 PAS domain-containing sensor histidine kinase [Halomicroarcula sp. S1AR25-4]